jgi:hypothetical protein
VQAGNGEIEANVGNLVDVKLGNANRTTPPPQNANGTPSANGNASGNRDGDPSPPESAQGSIARNAPTAAAGPQLGDEAPGTNETSSSPRAAVLQVGNGDIEANVGNLIDVKLGETNRATPPQNADGTARGNANGTSNANAIANANGDSSPQSDSPGITRARNAPTNGPASEPDAAPLADSNEAVTRGATAGTQLGLRVGNGDVEANVGNLVDVNLGDANRATLPQNANVNTIANANADGEALPEPLPAQSVIARNTSMNSAASQADVTPPTDANSPGLQIKSPIVLQIGNGEAEVNLGNLIDVKIGDGGRAPAPSKGATENAPVPQQSQASARSEATTGPSPEIEASPEENDATPRAGTQNAVAQLGDETSHIDSASVVLDAPSMHAQNSSISVSSEGADPPLKSPVGLRVESGEAEASIGNLIDVKLGDANRSPVLLPNANGNAPSSPPAPGPSARNAPTDAPTQNAEASQLVHEEPNPTRAATANVDVQLEDDTSQSKTTTVATRTPSISLQSADASPEAPSARPTPLIGLHVGNGEVEANVGNLIDVKLGKPNFPSRPSPSITGNAAPPQSVEAGETTNETPRALTVQSQIADAETAAKTSASQENSLVELHVGDNEVEANVSNLIEVKLGDANRPPIQPPNANPPATHGANVDDQLGDENSTANLASETPRPEADAQQTRPPIGLQIGDGEREANVGNLVDLKLGLPSRTTPPPNEGATAATNAPPPQTDASSADENEVAVPVRVHIGDGEIDARVGNLVDANVDVEIRAQRPPSLVEPYTESNVASTTAEPSSTVTEPQHRERPANVFTSIVQALFGRRVSNEAPAPRVDESAPTVSTSIVLEPTEPVTDATKESDPQPSPAPVSGEAEETVVLPSEAELAVAEAALSVSASRPGFVRPAAFALEAEPLVATEASLDGASATSGAARAALELAAARNAATLEPGSLQASGRIAEDTAAEAIAASAQRRPGVGVPLSGVVGAAIDEETKVSGRVSSPDSEGDRAPAKTREVEVSPLAGGLVTVPLTFAPDGSSIQKRRPKLDFGKIEVDPELVLRYAEAVRAERPWTWRGISGGRYVLPLERAAVRDAAFEGDWLPAIAIDPDSGAADFAGAGLARHSDRLDLEVRELESDAAEFADLESRVPAERLGAGLIWHRADESGTMQLVPASFHHAVRHAAARLAPAGGRS